MVRPTPRHLVHTHYLHWMHQFSALPSLSPLGSLGSTLSGRRLVALGSSMAAKALGRKRFIALMKKIRRPSRDFNERNRTQGGDFARQARVLLGTTTWQRGGTGRTPRPMDSPAAVHVLPPMATDGRPEPRPKL